MLPSGKYTIKYNQDMAIIRTRTQWLLLIIFLTLVFTFPTFGSPAHVALANTIGIAVIAVLGLNLLTGLTGQISLGQAAFMAVGAYASVTLNMNAGLPFIPALFCGGLISAAVGLFFGLPSLRIKGFYMAMASLAAHFIIIWTIKHTPDLTGGVDGMAVDAPSFLGINFDTEKSFFYITMFAVLILTVVAKNIARGRIGRALIAIRDNDIAAEAMGISLYRYKLLAFMLSAFYGGIAGGLMAYRIQYITPDNFQLMDSIWYLGMMIVGGMGSVSGALMGVTFLKTVEYMINQNMYRITDAFSSISIQASAALGVVVFSVIIIAFVLLEPRGMAHRWERLKTSYRLWPFSH